jgi:hypothetical protein
MCKGTIMRLALTALFLVFVIGSAAATVPPQEWRNKEGPVFGFRFSYPEELFTATGTEESSHYFESAAENAKFVVGAWRNTDGETPEEVKRWMLSNVGYDSITYEPRGRSWFVLSGYHRAKIFYQKALFSCGGRVVSLLAISYPIASRNVFDSVVERMEDSFRAARSCG